jgi:PhnB protein
MTRSTRAIPEGHHTVTPVLTVDGAAKALDWYQRALNAKVKSSSTGPDGKIVHAEIELGDSRIMLNDPMMGMKGARGFGGSPVSLWLYVDDCDRLFKQAVTAGGKERQPIADQFWGDRSGSFEDPFGLTWTVATHKEDLTRAELDERQAQFFGQLAGKEH